MRAELRGLAAESLALLRGALYDARFPALCELPVYGSIIGMFELNNLGALLGSKLRLKEGAVKGFYCFRSAAFTV